MIINDMMIRHSTEIAATGKTHAVGRRGLQVLIALYVLLISAQATAFTLQFGNEDFILSPVAGNVQTFQFTIDIDATLAAGIYENPPLVQIDYQVSGEPVVGSPSDFPAFALERSINGTEFYQAGNELVFEIADTAVLSDGIQAVELVGTTVILSFNAREEGTGRFHPAELELRADGTGLLQNSDNVPDIAEPGIPLGSEYITGITFDPGNLTLLIDDDTVQPDPEQVDSQDTEDVQPNGNESENSTTPSSDSSSGVTGIALLLILAISLFGRSALFFAVPHWRYHFQHRRR